MYFLFDDDEGQEELSGSFVGKNVAAGSGVLGQLARGKFCGDTIFKLIYHSDQSCLCSYFLIR
jgi:hypothetical protein